MYIICCNLDEVFHAIYFFTLYLKNFSRKSVIFKVRSVIFKSNFRWVSDTHCLHNILTIYWQYTQYTDTYWCTITLTYHTPFSPTDDGRSPWQHCPLATHALPPRHCGPPGSGTVCPWDGDLEGQGHLWKSDGLGLCLSGWEETRSRSWDGIAILEYSILEDILFGWKMRSGRRKHLDVKVKFHEVKDIQWFTYLMLFYKTAHNSE